MTETEPLPVFPTTAPEVFADVEATRALFRPVLGQLASVIDVDPARRSDPTPCAGFDVAALQRHVLAWLQFFAAALDDPDATGRRLDPDSWELAPADDPVAIVETAAATIDRAVAAGVATRLVTMSQARMAGDGVLAMALGEYLVHGWDLAAATGRPWSGVEEAAGPALAFLQSTVALEHRGPDSGFFDTEIPAPADASALERLVCFAGRQPGWTAPS